MISDLLLSRTTGKPSFTISRGIRDEQGVLLGIVVAGILPERLDEELGVKRILGGGFALVDAKGMLVYRYPAIEVTWEERNWLKQYPQFADALKGKEAEGDGLCTFRGKESAGRLHACSLHRLGRSAGQKEEDVNRPHWAAISRSAILFGSVASWPPSCSRSCFLERSQIPLRRCAVMRLPSERERRTADSRPVYFGIQGLGRCL